MCELVITCGDAAPVLKSTKAAFNNVAGFISLFIVADFLFAVGFAWDDSLDALFFEEGPDRIGIVAFVR